MLHPCVLYGDGRFFFTPTSFSARCDERCNDECCHRGPAKSLGIVSCVVRLGKYVARTTRAFFFVFCAQMIFFTPFFLFLFCFCFCFSPRSLYYRPGQEPAGGNVLRPFNKKRRTYRHNQVSIDACYDRDIPFFGENGF